MSCIPQLYGGNKVVQVYSDLVAISGTYLGNKTHISFEDQNQLVKQWLWLVAVKIW